MGDTAAPLSIPLDIPPQRSDERSVEEIAGMFDITGTFNSNAIQIVSPNWKPVSLNDVRNNLYKEVVNPEATYQYRGGVGNFLVASTAVAGELSKYGTQNVMHPVSHIKWLPEALGAMASTVDLLVVSPVKWLIKSEFEANCSKEQLARFSQKYDELPDSTKLLAEILGDGVILGNTVKIFDIAKNRVKILSIEGSPKSLLAIEVGVSEISATSGVGKLSVDTGMALGENVPTKPIPLEIKPTTSSVTLLLPTK